MRTPGHVRLWGRVAVIGVGLALAAAGCSSSGSGSASGSSTSAGTSVGSSSGSSSASSGSASSGSAGSGVAAAKAAIAPYTGHPSAFPASQKLSTLPPAGAEFVYLQCATPTCAKIGALLAAPVKAIGGKLTVINSGATATSSQSAAAAALAKKPVAVLLPATDPQLFGNALHQLDSAGIAVTGVGIIGGEPYGVRATVGGLPGTQLAGKLMADWVVANKGEHAKVTFYSIPELSFSTPMKDSFSSELKATCPSCSLDVQSISVTTFGSTAPNKIVSYLRSHSSTNTVVFAAMEAATGLAAALKVAGISPTTVGFAPSPSNLQDIMSGGLTAGLGLDLPVQEWLQVNATARLLAHQSIDANSLSADLQFLTKSDVTAAIAARGWTGYPDVATRFAALWPAR